MLQNPSFDTEFRAILEYENSKGILMRYVFFLVYAETIKLSNEHDSYKWINIQELPIYLHMMIFVLFIDKQQKDYPFSTLSLPTTLFWSNQ